MKDKRIIKFIITTICVICIFTSCTYTSNNDNDQKMVYKVEDKNQTDDISNTRKIDKFIEENENIITISVKNMEIPLKLILKNKTEEDVVNTKMPFIEVMEIVENKPENKFYKIEDEYVNSQFIEKIIVDQKLYEKSKELYNFETEIGFYIAEQWLSKYEATDKNIINLKKMLIKKEQLIKEIEKMDYDVYI